MRCRDCGVCCTRTMRVSYIAIIGRAGEDGNGDRDCVLVVRAYGLGGENGDNTKRGKRCVNNKCSRPRIQTNHRVCLLGNADTDLTIEIRRFVRLQRAWACFHRHKMKSYDRLGGRSRLKVRLLKAEVVETLVYGCMTWIPNKSEYDSLRQVHHSMLLRCLGGRKRKRDDHTLSYADAFAKTASESIEAIVRKRRILFAGFVARIGEERLP